MCRRDGAGARLHRLDHRPDLLAANLTDDLARQVEPEGIDESLVERELPSLASVDATLAGARPGLPRVHDAVPFGQLVEVQFVLGLERADRLKRVDLGAQRPDQGGLAG